MYIDTLNSTNDYLKAHTDLDEVWTSFQTAGRGQAGNGWESEKGKNVLVSVRLHPKNMLAIEQWNITMQVSVALWQIVAKYIDPVEKLTIKWPNDLYFGDHKLAGVLIENTLCGPYIGECIVGIGLNVNQTTWIGNAPNPISIQQINGKENDVTDIAHRIIGALHNINITSANCREWYERYLYRRKGWFWWEEREVSTQPTMNSKKSAQSFEAEIAGITDQGELVLRKRNQEEKKYHFKQIKYII